MGHLPALAFILLQPAIVWSQATAPAAPGGTNNPLISLNIPNLGNLLGGLLGGLGLGGTVPNYGGGFGTTGLGFGNMLGLFNQHNNLFFNQLLFNGFLGMAVFKFTALTVILGTFMVGGMLIKFLAIAAIMSLIKWNPGHRSIPEYRSTSQPFQSWQHHPDSAFMWEGRRSRHFQLQ